MNILIVGNGFDLSHYLPTKYDHFMDVMRAIEEKNLGQPILDVFRNSVDDFPTLLMKILEVKKALNEKNYEMGFDELFSKCREKGFIDKTKSIYEIHSIKLDFEKIIEIQYLLKNNGWYQYFKVHLKDIDTWIDFENKIEDALRILSRCVLEFKKLENLYEVTQFLAGLNAVNLDLKGNDLDFLNYFEFSKDEKIINKFMPVSGVEQKIESSRKNINPKFCYGNKIKNGLNPNIFINSIHKQLEEFIEIFNIYLELIINKLESKTKFIIESHSWVQPDHIFSFNYTDTFRKFYTSVNTDFLHGRFGENQNIVLGISDLEDEELKKLKAFGFTKYHQKLFKDTDYLFLDEKVSKVKLYKNNFSNYTRDYRHQSSQQFNETINKLESLNLNIEVWGHSLDVSDQDYIKDLFSLNNDIDRNVKVTVYFFDKPAKFLLLNNLLAILGKDKVEHWMKKGWLKFEKNPEINFGV